MHIKTRRNRALLYRSAWVPKGTAGNTHGYTHQRYVGSIPLTAAAISPNLQSKLSPAELAFVESKVCTPARQRASEENRAAEQREMDPAWRIEEALRLLGEAADRSAGQPVPAALVEQLQQVVGGLHAKGSAVTAVTTESADPLAEALTGIRTAAQSVAAGHYGKAPAEGVRTTRTYKLWSQLLDSVQGDTDGSLLRALQESGYVKRRGH
ncbi:conserved hypothetical protein [Thiomonas arsenitoxydans]|uniref:Uncharacterized protein n=1 Tax=Thiomonas arsenitoxydans (strain DSM 22701 / CIP 110005 / 3As) TaxID=426114 RepID=D6CSA2_THIA3|nr:hypothetical protein [Thiomonas arsenitoxydans]CAZ87630.1 Hypothetical protein THI_0927 [Thiomonas arsenitoxydans]CQR26943.1 conserved hypothetical protein [Thiomonas arsenitoxydans]CQR30229.1 conserved hypothetical protein [Thiomonas arsenitoxydans]CQR30285.1 conserved hypothetical protein [Thiomonas arsenitoxydans]CQR32333.1 conserved hypothetical protein [Thiomonas arsenitoxydans]